MLKLDLEAARGATVADVLPPAGPRAGGRVPFVPAVPSNELK